MKTERSLSFRGNLAAWSMTVCALWGAGTVAAAPLTLSTLVRTNDPAPGVTAPNSVSSTFLFVSPGQVPNHQFGPPVAASLGRYAFPAAVAHRNADGNLLRVDTGIWGGVQGGGLTVQFQQRLGAPPLGSNFTQRGLFNLSETGHVAFFAQTTAASGPPDGIWVGSVGGGPLQIAHRLSIAPTTLGLIRPLQTGRFVGYHFQNTNWLYDATSQELRVVCWIGMLFDFDVFGPGVQLTSLANLALTLDGAFLVQGNTSDGTNRILRIKGPSEVTPVLAQGQPAPGLPGYTIGSMGASANERADVAMLTRLVDGDANPFNDRSAYFAGPYTNVTLLAVSPPGVFWGGVSITRSNHVLGASASGQGIYKLPTSPGEPTTFTPVPPFPHPPLTPVGSTLIASSLNALGQYVLLYGYSSGAANPLNPGIDLWLFNPGDGWTNLARLGSNIVASGETIRVNSIGFQGGGGAGYARGLDDDGRLLFTINGTHIITTGAEASHDFYWTGALGLNWHTTITTPPFTSWVSVERNLRKQPPGDAEPNTARVVIPSGFSVELTNRPTPIGSLHSDGELTLRQHLTLNRTSVLHNLLLESMNAALTLNENSVIKHRLDWRGGRIDGIGSLAVSNLFVTNGGTVMLQTALTVHTNGMFDNGATMKLANAVIANRGEFRVGLGTITNEANDSVFQNYGGLRKESTNEFTIHTHFQSFERAREFNRFPPRNIHVDDGRLRLSGGSDFFDFQTVGVRTNAVCELTGAFNFAPLDGEVNAAFTGDGMVELGTTNMDINVQVATNFNSKLTLQMNGGAYFNAGLLESASAYCWNLGRFVWKGGRIAIALNHGDQYNQYTYGDVLFEIDDSGGQPRQLEGQLSNEAKVVQRGAFELSGSAINSRSWRIEKSVGITTSGDKARFFNRGSFQILLTEPGGVTIDVPFENFEGAAYSRERGPGAVRVGSLEQMNQATTVQFLGSVKNVMGNVLNGGIWEVGPNCTLILPEMIHTVSGYRTEVTIRAGEIPSLQLRANSGGVSFKDKQYSTPGDLVNEGFLYVGKNSVLTVNGNLLSPGDVNCDGQILVKGDATFGRRRFDVNGRIKCDGVMTVDGQLRANGVMEGYYFRFNGDVAVGQSPGSLSLIGLTALTNTSVLVMEISGTASNQFDQLLVSTNAQLGGILAVNLLDGFVPAPGDVFPILRAGSIAGQFANATHGQRLATIDGYGSFLVNYTPTSVVLSGFQSNPNPPPTAPGRLQPPTFSFNTLNLTLAGSPGRDYILQSSTNLFDWLSFLTNNAGFDGQLRFELPVTTDPYRYFRALGR